MRAVSRGRHSQNLQTDVEIKSKQQVNPALRLPAGRYVALKIDIMKQKSRTSCSLSTILLIVLSLILFSSCNREKRLIKNDLNSRFTKFDLIEIKPDSSNVKDAIFSLMSLKIRVSESNLKIIQGITEIESNNGSKASYQTFLLIDSVYNKTISDFEKFEKTRYSKPDKCFYVKFLVYKEEIKIPHEEYIVINDENDNVFHRPYDWDEFLVQEGYNDLVNSALTYTKDLMDLRYKFTGKY
jgi:hypothetical protein